MLLHLRSDSFSKQLLHAVYQDPVHSITDRRNLERRCRYDRNIFFLVEDNKPVAVLCVAFTNGLPNNIDEILDVDSPVALTATHAIFYSVFRTDAPCETQNAGAKLIRQAAQWIKANMSHINNYVTMSPIPNLSAHFAEPPSMEAIAEFLQAQKDPVAKFHIRNGARILRVIPNADNSEKRKAQSYMNMVNYDYTPNIKGVE
jgi:malonyl-CoA decarboxylase